MRALSRLAGYLGSGLLLAGWERVHACATCFGVSDSKLAQGMNWGILSLLVVIVSVLAGIALFFAVLVRRAARLAEIPVETEAAAAVSAASRDEAAEILN